jgi:hypothetical protein
LDQLAARPLATKAVTCFVGALGVERGGG